MTAGLIKCHESIVHEGSEEVKQADMKLCRDQVDWLR